MPHAVLGVVALHRQQHCVGRLLVELSPHRSRGRWMHRLDSGVDSPARDAQGTRFLRGIAQDHAEARPIPFTPLGATMLSKSNALQKIRFAGQEVAILPSKHPQFGCQRCQAHTWESKMAAVPSFEAESIHRGRPVTRSWRKLPQCPLLKSVPVRGQWHELPKEPQDREAELG